MNKKIKIGIIGGSGIYSLEGLKKIKELKIKTPFGNPSDKVITGELNSTKVAFLPRHGKGHHIPPSGINYRANIYAMKKMGVENLISVSAVGSMQETIRPGDFVVVDQYFDRTRSRASTFFDNGIVAHIPFDKPVCSSLSDEVGKVCKVEGIRTHLGGTYICIEGPQFSTFAESKIYRSWGMDVIGMTALPEARLAREAEICYCTLALVTDYDCWNTSQGVVSADLVVTQMKENSKKARKVLKRIIPNLGEEEFLSCRCRKALENSIVTEKDKIDKSAAKKLKLIIEKYL